MILAMDVCNEVGSIALLDGARLLEERRLESPDGFGHILFGAIEELLAAHGVPLSAIDLYAVATGPGSFTGVRIGLTAAKGLAFASGKPLAGVTNLEALASLGSGPLRAPVFDARRGDVYGAVYDDALVVVVPPMVCPLEAFPIGEAKRIDAGPLLAAAVGRLAAQRGGVHPAAVDATYVRPSDAELLNFSS
jgi:tRNA threonylcarbamoyladenosine biosynthesis protein TsaB